MSENNICNNSNNMETKDIHPNNNVIQPQSLNVIGLGSMLLIDPVRYNNLVSENEKLRKENNDLHNHITNITSNFNNQVGALMNKIEILEKENAELKKENEELKIKINNLHSR